MNEYSGQELRLLKDKVNTLFNSNPNWKVVGLHIKEKNGQLTSDIAITLIVDQKLPVNEIDSNDLFPDSITIPGLSEPVKTDVQVGPTEFKALGCYTLPTPGTDDSGWAMPVSGSRMTHRPLMGGIGCTTIPPNGYGGSVISAGTLGGFCIDLDDNTIVGVSNNHVIGGNQVRGDMTLTMGYAGQYSAHKNDYHQTYWSILSTNDIASNESIPHPIFQQPETHYPVHQRTSWDEYTSSYGSGSTGLSALKVGTVKRAYPLTSSNNKIDVAIFALDTTINSMSALISTTESWKQYLLDYDTPMDFATTAEIDSLLTTASGSPVFRSGRTEGPVGWPGSDPYGSDGRPSNVGCSLSAYGVTDAANINYGGNIETIGYVEQIFVRGTTDPSTGGDSGSFVCGLFNEGNPSLSAWKIIGLLFAGSDAGNYMIANRIDNVASMFNLGAYKGETLDIGYKNVDIKVIDTRQSAVTARIGGKMYWQAGSTNSPATGRFDT